MDTVFLRMIKEHRERYPLMEPQDYGKLAYQSEFGAEHLAADRQTVLEFLLEELKTLSAEASPRMPEEIGGGLCRFPLTACPTEAEAELLADLFLRTAEKSRGTAEGLLDKMNQIAGHRIPGMPEWFAAWNQNGCPPVHHSESYRNAYAPHYRLLQKDFAAYFPALAEINRLVRTGRCAIIGIDGRCGSGKTHFTQLACDLFPCNVIHMDDFYLPAEKRQQHWEEIPGGNIDLVRLYTEVLLPLRENRQIVYRPYSCEKGAITEEKALPYRNVTVIEGSYSHHPKLLAGYDLKIFLDCGKEEQKRRLKAREGSYYTEFANRWIPMEERYFQRYRVEEECALRVDTSEILYE